MGLLSWASSSSSSSSSDPQPSQAPTRSNRKACWESRDAYFDCLTRNKVIIPPGTDLSDASRGRIKPKTPEEVDAARAQDPCVPARDVYERHCVHSWVEYFNKRRVMEERQRRMNESSSPTPVSIAK